MKVGVVVAANNAAATIGQQLKALVDQSRDDFSVHVVDDASRDGTVREVERFSSLLDLRVITLTDRVGAAAAKNVGGFRAAAAAEVLLFCDSDDIVGPRWVESLSAALAVDSLVGGRSSFVLLNTQEQLSWYGRDERLYGIRYCGGRLPYATGASLGIRSDLFAALDGYDERFVAAHDDVDICFRARRRGVDVRLAPEEALVHRRLRTSARAMALQQFNYAQSHNAFLLQHRMKPVGIPHDALVRTLTWAPRLMVTPTGRRRWLKTAAWTAGLLRSQGAGSTVGLDSTSRG